MLKQKLRRAGFFAQGLLIIAAFDKIVDRSPLYGLATQPAADSSRPFSDSSDIHLAVSLTPQIGLNKYAKPYAKEYIRKNIVTLLKVKSTSDPYFKIIEDIFQQQGLPVELKYLAVVESKLKPTAVSRVGAVGPWQLMPVTGRSLGLVITKKYDERKLYFKSTLAAAKYLNELHGKFNDWLLVVAAYNSGAGNVYKAIKKSGSRNFWKLQAFLPAETREHVKRFIAVHYYFEGKGSLTTMTKAETAEYEKKLEALIAEQESMVPQDEKLLLVKD
jgi:membrane-bound lytic murein transglycosylase D